MPFRAMESRTTYLGMQRAANARNLLLVIGLFIIPLLLLNNVHGQARLVQNYGRVPVLLFEVLLALAASICLVGVAIFDRRRLEYRRKYREIAACKS